MTATLTTDWTPLVNLPRGTVLSRRQDGLEWKYVKRSGRCHYLRSGQTGRVTAWTDAELSDCIQRGALTVERYEPQETAR